MQNYLPIPSKDDGFTAKTSVAIALPTCGERKLKPRKRQNAHLFACNNPTPYGRSPLRTIEGNFCHMEVAHVIGQIRKQA